MQISCYISSRDEEYKCHFTWAWNGKYKTFNLPNIIPPYKKRVKGSYINGEEKQVDYDYEQIIRRQYGFCLDAEYICFYYGINECDSKIDQKTSFTIPWLDQIFVKKEYYNLDGTVYASVPHVSGINSPFWKACQEIEQKIPKIKFTFNDFDGEEVEGECFLVKQFYTKGSGLFKWLKYITKTKGFLRAEVNYNKEVGIRKNSWKGGTLSCSFYCADESLTIEQILQNYAKEEKFKNLRII